MSVIGLFPCCQGGAGEKPARPPESKKSAATAMAESPSATAAAAIGKKYRIIDFKRKRSAICRRRCKTLEYDPNRSAHIALVQYEDGEKRYHRSERPEGRRRRRLGYRRGHQARQCPPLSSIPVGTFIHNVELYPGKGAQLARSAGTMAQLMGRKTSSPCGCPPASCATSRELHGFHRPGLQHRP